MGFPESQQRRSGIFTAISEVGHELTLRERPVVAQIGHSSKNRLQLCGMNGHASLREWARPSIALLGRSSSARRPDVGDVCEAILCARDLVTLLTISVAACW
jgi:hypothetical protein